MEEFIEAVEANNPDYILNINKDLLKECSILKSWQIKKESKKETKKDVDLEKIGISDLIDMSMEDDPLNNDKVEKKDNEEKISDVNYYLLENDKTKEQYISIEQSAPCYWIKVGDLSVEQQVKQIEKVYNVKEYKKNMPKICRAFIGTKDMLNINIDQIVNNLVLNLNSEMYVWGSYWEDYPFERNSDGQNNFQNIYKTKEALKQINDDYYSIGFRTMHSKSIVTVIDYQGIYIVDINYCPTDEHKLIEKINSELSTDYPLDMPIDILMLLNSFPFINYTSILNMPRITETNILIATLICADRKDKLKEIKKLLKQLNGHEDQKVRKAAKHLYNTIK